METTAFARLESYEHSDERELVSEDFSAVALEPFVITWKTRENEITAAFERWLDAGVTDRDQYGREARLQVTAEDAWKESSLP